MNGFAFPKDKLDGHLDFVRKEIGRIEKQLHEIENMKYYYKEADDALRIRVGYQNILAELKSVLRYNYDCENI